MHVSLRLFGFPGLSKWKGKQYSVICYKNPNMSIYENFTANIRSLLKIMVNYNYLSKSEMT